MQNLSARYNYRYNANVLLQNYQESIAQSHKDNYEDFLTIYIAPDPINFDSNTNAQSSSKELEDIAKKAQIIVSEKSLSNYLDEAYILLGKTNFYNGNYFSAIEYFDYTARAYKKDKNISLEALNWKARSLMQINNFKLALKVLDSIAPNIPLAKTDKAEPLATLAQINIKLRNYKKAINFLERAIKESNKIESRTRWPYILGQLYEHEKEYDEALANYTRVENSNAPFEMYFNAKLSKIRIYDLLKDKTSNRKKQLLSLLKDDKNLDYTDKIFYEVAQDYFEDDNYLKAEEFYKSSAKNSTNNAYQKGLSFLKIADLNFKNLRNYVNAKLYYDSAAITLPKNHPNYNAIVKKAENLEYLTKRYESIALQDTLQLFAKLPQTQRENRIEALLFPKKLEITSDKITKNGRAINLSSTETTGNGTFYFSNSVAISRGFTDFKKRWGNRPLENNWRQSVKSSVMLAQQKQNLAIGNDNKIDTNRQSKADTLQTDTIKSFIALLPLTAEKLKESDQKIIDAYFEIAGFYQQVIEDQLEAIKTYETLLDRFPENNHLDAIFYSLYLGYSQTDPSKAEQYKNKVLAKFPGSVYAKTILDANYSVKQNALDLELNKIYNEVFSAYEQKEFQKIITKVAEVSSRFPGNNLQVQYDYLKAIAIGKTQNVDSLFAAFNHIVTKYPEDKLITPLVKEHLTYINKNIATFKPRKIALIDFDLGEPRFFAQQEPIVEKPKLPETSSDPITEKPTEKQAILATIKVDYQQTAVKPSNEIKLVEGKKLPLIPTKLPDTSIAITAQTVAIPSIKAEEKKVTDPVLNQAITKPTEKTIEEDNLFSKAESSTYYFIVAVADVSLSLSSSRFGIGQFNRGNFAGLGIKHQLLELDEDQLIYVGDFNSLNEVKEYHKLIGAQLSKIMKVPTNNYNGFFISIQNFEKLKNRDALNRYLIFFKKNYSNE